MISSMELSITVASPFFKSSMAFSASSLKTPPEIFSTAVPILSSMSSGRIIKLCNEGRFELAIKIGWSWIIPKKSVLSFKRKRRGVKPSKVKTDREIIEETLDEIKKWKGTQANKNP